MNELNSGNGDKESYSEQENLEVQTAVRAQSSEFKNCPFTMIRCGDVLDCALGFTANLAFNNGRKVQVRQCAFVANVNTLNEVVKASAATANILSAMMQSQQGQQRPPTGPKLVVPTALFPKKI